MGLDSNAGRLHLWFVVGPCERATVRCVCRAELGHDLLALAFGHVLDEVSYACLSLGVGVDAGHHAFSASVAGGRAGRTSFKTTVRFQPVTGHPLQVSPMFGIVFDVGVNFRLHFGVNPVSWAGLCGALAPGAPLGAGLVFVVLIMRF